MNIIEQYLEKKVDKLNKENKEWSQERNDEPCVVCKNKTFVQKFRNVVGEISGYLRGSYSLFGGSFYGSIDGYTKTLPILSCRKCGNEKKIKTYEKQTEEMAFWSDMDDFYFGLKENDATQLKDIPEIYLHNAKATRDYMKKNENYNYTFYNELAYYSAKVWAEAGFKGLEKKKKIKFLFWERTKTTYSFD